jgi:hypothetical protein
MLPPGEIQWMMLPPQIANQEDMIAALKIDVCAPFHRSP